MKEVYENLIQKYDGLIDVLEVIYKSDKEFLHTATLNRNIAQAEVDQRMISARDNLRRLQFAKAEKELLQSYLK